MRHPCRSPIESNAYVLVDIPSLYDMDHIVGDGQIQRATCHRLFKDLIISYHVISSQLWIPLVYVSSYVDSTQHFDVDHIARLFGGKHEPHSDYSNTMSQVHPHIDDVFATCAQTSGDSFKQVVGDLSFMEMISSISMPFPWTFHYINYWYYRYLKLTILIWSIYP